MYKVMSFTLQGLFIGAVPSEDISGLRAHIKLASGSILYVSDEMTKEAAEQHCEQIIKESYGDNKID